MNTITMLSICDPITPTPPSYRKAVIIFQFFGIRPGTKRWSDYEAGLSILRAFCETDEDYEYHQKCLVDYLEV